jgi:hypothetical protein
MTYLIIGETEEIQLSVLDDLFSKFYGRNFTDLVEGKESTDIHILDGKEKSSLGIEDVKNFQSEFLFHPFEGEFQTGVIFQAEKLTHEAQNAFLKTLEESSDHTIFILCTTNERNLLPTIISRSRKIFGHGSSSEGNFEEKFNPQSSLIDIFGRIEEVSQSSDKALEFLKFLEIFYKRQLENDIRKRRGSTMNSSKNLKEIHTAKERILANGNRRLVLENLILKLRK